MRSDRMATDGAKKVEKASRSRVIKPAPAKTIKEMFSVASPTGDPMQQLELTLQTHTSMFDHILQAIQDSKVALEAQIGAIQMESGLLRADHAKLSAHVAETEATLASVRPTVLAMQTQMRAR